MYNVTMIYVRATIVAVEIQWVLHDITMCSCSFWNAARNAHAPYNHLWPAPLHSIFQLYLTNGRLFEKSNWKKLF